MDIEFPEKLRFLFEPTRYKVAYGGRGGAKSWGFARALILLGAKEKLRILCAREVQKSIQQSVHQLLSDQIQALGLGAFYEILQSEIRGVNGTQIAFAGLSSYTVESIKSFEGVDICWVEEAQAVSKKSWDILIPTIRKPNSEIWVSFNPDLDTDETYVRFVENTPDNCHVVKINYSDNPWFPKVLEAERLHTKNVDPKGYLNIWEGECKAAADGAIYADEIVQAQEKKRVCNVPYDPAFKVHVIFDLGWNDSMSIILAQRHLSEVRVIGYIEDDHKTLDYYSATLKDLKYNWGDLFLPHDGEQKDYKYGKSAQEIMQDLGWNVKIIPRADIEQGIKQARMMFPRIYFDKNSTVRLLQCLKNYKRRINQITGEAGEPLHDEYSHGADCFRYLAVSAERMSNDEWGSQKVNYPRLGIV